MKLKDKIADVHKDVEKEMTKYLEYSQVGSFFNFMEDAVNEINDNKLKELFNSLQTHINSKRKELWEKELS